MITDLNNSTCRWVCFSSFMSPTFRLSNNDLLSDCIEKLVFQHKCNQNLVENNANKSVNSPLNLKLAVEHLLAILVMGTNSVNRIFMLWKNIKKLISSLRIFGQIWYETEKSAY